MSGFSTQWLELREPYDRAARNPVVLSAIRAALADRDAIAVVDLGCGTGSTLRAISPLLPARQNWLLLDRDEALLAAARIQTKAANSAATIATKTVDLADQFELMLDGADLITMSALLDLVSAAWLDRLIEAAAQRQLPIYAALSYDGQVTLAPTNPHDAAALAAFNRHQRTDKGFGPALGPGAAEVAPERLRRMGFTVVEGSSDWHLGAADHDIQMEMLTGFADAAGAMGMSASILGDWLAARRAHVAGGLSTIRVGHVDFFGVPACA